MRIIAGEYRHRQLFTPRDGTVTRPIPDRVKESLFALLRGWTEDAAVLDAFAGTGAIGLEAVSRGAARCVFIERDKRIAEILERNIESLGCGDRCEVVRGDALGAAALSRCPRPMDLVFFDPPFPLVRDPASWERVRLQLSRMIPLMNPRSFLVLRTPWPFRHREVIEGGAVAAAPERARGKNGHHRDQDGDDAIELGDGRDFSEIEVLDGEEDAGDDEGREADEGAVPSAGWKDVELGIAGAVGPETHVYGSSGVHLYMPAPLADATSGGEAR